MNNNEIKKIAQKALEIEYGFAPALKAIRLLEASGDGNYILFQVKEHEYKSYWGVIVDKSTGNEENLRKQYEEMNQIKMERIWDLEKQLHETIGELRAMKKLNEIVRE